MSGFGFATLETEMAGRRPKTEELSSPEKLQQLGPQAGDLIRAYVARVEKIDDEIVPLNDAKAEVYDEARAVGLNPKILKEVIRRRRKPRQEVEEADWELETYERILAAGGPKAPNLRVVKNPLDE